MICKIRYSFQSGGDAINVKITNSKAMNILNEGQRLQSKTPRLHLQICRNICSIYSPFMSYRTRFSQVFSYII